MASELPIGTIILWLASVDPGALPEGSEWALAGTWIDCSVKVQACSAMGLRPSIRYGSWARLPECPHEMSHALCLVRVR